MGKALMMSFNCVRSAVKSVFTWRTVEYSMMATRSAVLIWVSMNFSAASCARNCSGIPIDEKSKNITIRRLS